MERRVGILGGTGWAADDAAERLVVETPWGEVEVRSRAAGDLRVFVVARHREGHRLPPHRVPHRANVEALARCGVTRVLAVNVVGGLVPAAAPGRAVVPDDLLDLSHHPERTFHDEAAVHVDFAEPYCAETRAAVVAAAREEGLAPVDGGVYACTAGPRLETRAEVRALVAMGGTVVGMTGGPEAALARERGLCYASLCLVANAASGVAAEPLSAAAIREAAGALADGAARALARAAAALPAARGCACGRAPDAARL